MPIIAAGQQKALIDLKPPAAGGRRLAPGRFAAGKAAPAPPEPERIGVVFVHGIGSQVPGETLLDWSRPIIKVLTEWRQRHGHPPDPVVASRIDFTGAEPAVIQLDVPRMPPEADDPHDHPAQTWFVTEAWWASNVRPPSLGTMARWLTQDMVRVVSAVQQAANDRRQAGEPGTEGLSWWVHAVDELQSFAVATVVGILWTIGAALGLPYSIVRSLPLVGDKIAIAQLDTFLIDWFGDLRVLLHDQAQAANIRSRLGETLTVMRDDYKCSSILLVAHSGGVIVSLTTLNDPLYASTAGVGAFPVTKLLTIGQGMALAWRLWNFWKVRPPGGDRLMAPPYDQYPRLRWVDFWGTYDPAPAGEFKPPPPPKEPPKPDAPPDPVLDVKQSGRAFIPSHSRPIWNRMSFREDHGGYWDNEEQFIVELVREIDTAADTADQPTRPSRFFHVPADQAIRVRRRIERVAVLGWWRWLTAIAALVTMIGAWRHGAGTGSSRLADIGGFAAQEFSKLPGHETVSGPLDSVANVAAQIGLVPVLGPLVALLGQAAIVLAILLVALAVPGWYGLWHRLAHRIDPKERFEAALRGVHWPNWLPPRIAVALALYAIGAAVVAAGSTFSITPVVNARSWLADRVHSLWTAQTGNVLFGLVVVILVFVVIEVWGASRWTGWDERERYESRKRPVPVSTDRLRIKAQAVLFLLLLVAAVVVIAFVEVP